MIGNSMTGVGGSGRRREKFLPEEDARLRSLVEIYGTTSWGTIAAGLPGRNVRQCRDRWKHYLSSETRNEPWAAGDDQLLMQKMQEFGPRWTILATFFPGRTDTQVKNRWMQQFADRSTLHLQNRVKQFANITATALTWQKPPDAQPMVPEPSAAEHRTFAMLPFHRDHSDVIQWTPQR
jgi:hypothetical protein